MDTVTHYTLQLQGSRVQTHVKIAGLQSWVGGLRGRITEFTRASRKRCMDMTASIDIAKAFASGEVRPKFLTFTYGQRWPSMRLVKKHKRAFEKWMDRHYPECSGLWKLEFQRRGAPHLHFIMFGLPYVYQSVIWWAWGQIIGVEYWNHEAKSGYPEPPVVDIRVIHSPRQLMFYVSKYVAKVGLPLERFLAEAANDEDAGASSFTNSAYLSDEGHEGSWVGRFWGVFNRKNFPFAELVTVVVQNVGAAHNHFRRLMARKRRWAAPGRRDVGYTLYTDAALPWLDYWLHCLLEYG